LAVTVLRGRGRPFIAGVAVSGLALLALLNVAAPDAFIARFNLARAATAGRDATTVLDLQSLANLSGEAAGIATTATLAADSTLGGVTAAAIRSQRCEAASTLLHRWGPVSKQSIRMHSLDGWRFRNAGEVAALRAVGARSAELRRVVHAECRKGDSEPPSTREAAP
jgi:hypothetical protein